jgi:hypothetical protein
MDCTAFRIHRRLDGKFIVEKLVRINEDKVWVYCDCLGNPLSECLAGPTAEYATLKMAKRAIRHFHDGEAYFDCNGRVVNVSEARGKL